MKEVEEIVDRLQEMDVQAAIVAQSGQMDISAMLAAGWTIDESETEVLHGKRIRTLHAPA